MTSFLHDLKDPGANFCPVCGEMRSVCQCTDGDLSSYFDVEEDFTDDDPLGIEYGMWANTSLGLDDDPDDEWAEYYDN